MVASLYADAMQRVVEKSLTVIDLLVVAHQLKDQRETGHLIALYRSWIEHNPDHPILYAILMNYGIVLSDVQELPAARDVLLESVRLNPDFLQSNLTLATLYERLGQAADALALFRGVADKLGSVTGEAIKFKTQALKNFGRIFQENKAEDRAEEAFRQSLEINPYQRDLIQHWINLRQRQCKWPILEAFGKLTADQLFKAISPLSLAAYRDDPLLQLANASSFSKLDVPRPSQTFFSPGEPPVPRRNERLRVGYLSSDLCEHAVGYLLAELFELHDRAKVDVYAYYCGPQTEAPLHHRIKRATEHWVDISQTPDSAAAARIVNDGIDILIDLNGHTRGARTGIVAMRPAPIIVNWLGFPGTMGSPYHHYIIADEAIIPTSHALFYSEEVLRLPCYQPNDRKRFTSPDLVTRSSAGLPDQAMVYCSFNETRKITPLIWKHWMAILAAVPNSVLWLLTGEDATNLRLRGLAEQHGIAPDRLVFAPRILHRDHLARFALADLFLDTFPYGAHTTATNALWAGIPVLTLAGKCFASRVCGSLVAAAGIPDLVCHDIDRYVQVAIELGTNGEIRERYRETLRFRRAHCRLFDTPLLVTSLEALYAAIWEKYQNGYLPRPNLANFDVYQEIGIEIDHPDIELLTIGPYKELYRERLIQKDSLCFLSEDGRLWPPAKDEASV